MQKSGNNSPQREQDNCFITSVQEKQNESNRRETLQGLRVKGDVYARRIEHEKLKIEELRKNCNVVQRDIHNEKVLFQPSASSKDRILSNRQMRPLMEKLNRGNATLNEKISANNAVRERVDEARRRRLDALSDEAKLSENTEIIGEDIERIGHEMNLLWKEKQHLNDEMKELQEETLQTQKEYRLQKQALTKRSDPKSATLQKNQQGGKKTEKTMTLKSAHQMAWTVGMKKTVLKKNNVDMQDLKEQLDTLRSSGGVESINEFIQLYKEGEADMATLYGMIQEFQSQAESTQEEILRVEKDISRMKTKASKCASSEQSIAELQESLRKEEKECSRWQEKTQDVMTQFQALTPTVDTLFEKMGGNDRIFGDAPGSGLGQGILQHLGFIEEKCHSLLLTRILKHDGNQLDSVSSYCSEMHRLLTLKSKKRPVQPEFFPSLMDEPYLLDGDDVADWEEQNESEEDHGVVAINSKEFFQRVYNR